MMQISLKDDYAAKQWKEEVDRLNEETATLLKHVGLALENVKNSGEADVIDDIVHWGTNITNGINNILQGMGQLAGAVTELLQVANTIKDTIKDGIKGAIKGVANFIGG